MSNDMNNSELHAVGPVVTDPVALELIARATRARILSRLGTALLVGSVVIGFIAARIIDGSPSSTLVGVVGAFLPFWIAAFVMSSATKRANVAVSLANPESAAIAQEHLATRKASPTAPLFGDE
jgi:uncharacterized membrane protein YeaQ/YmgE (transglycosylase-associated protein family)